MPIFSILIINTDDLIDVENGEIGGADGDGADGGGADSDAIGESVNMMPAVGPSHSIGLVRIFATFEFLNWDPSCRQTAKLSSSAK